jgi:hypothetical protein
MTELKPTTTVLIYFRRNPYLTLEEFYNYWQNQHAQIVAPWMEKHGWLGYRQVQYLGPPRKPLANRNHS